jgi:hypothetical protein
VNRCDFCPDKLPEISNLSRNSKIYVIGFLLGMNVSRFTLFKVNIFLDQKEVHGFI